MAPIATLPFCAIERRFAPVEEEIASGLLPPCPLMERVAIGVPVPMPNRLFVLSKKKLALF